MRLLESIAELLFPDHVVCKLCGNEALVGPDGMCAPCRAGLLHSDAPLTPPDALDGLVAGLVYHGSVTTAVQRFKYHGQIWLARFLADWITLPPDWAIDCMIPVPLHPLRKWTRSFNQSELLACELQRRYPVPIGCKLLMRTRYTRPQARLHAMQRAANLTDAFRASPQVRGLSVLLIDDVTTTHSTLTACAQALRQAGARRVYGACACVAALGAQAVSQAQDESRG